MVRISREMRFQLVGNTSLKFMVLAANVHNNKVTFTIAVQLFGLLSVEKAANARKIS